MRKATRLNCIAYCSKTHTEAIQSFSQTTLKYLSWHSNAAAAAAMWNYDKWTIWRQNSVFKVSMRAHLDQQRKRNLSKLRHFGSNYCRYSNSVFETNKQTDEAKFGSQLQPLTWTFRVFKRSISAKLAIQKQLKWTFHLLLLFRVNDLLLLNFKRIFTLFNSGPTFSQQTKCTNYLGSFKASEQNKACEINIIFHITWSILTCSWWSSKNGIKCTDNTMQVFC